MTKGTKKPTRGAKARSDATDRTTGEPVSFRPFEKLPALDSAEPAAKRDSKQAVRSNQPKKPTTEDPDDTLTFERFMSGVAVLDDPRARRVPVSRVEHDTVKTSKQQRDTRHAELEQAARQRLHRLVEEGSRFEISDDGRRIEGRRRGVDGGLVRKLLLGELRVDAMLDLEGLRPEQARHAVERFVCDHRVKGDRVVGIVHGHRLSAAGAPFVLRGEVAAWLSEGKASTHVSAFGSAPEEHGGEGTLLVLLANDARSNQRV